MFQTVSALQLLDFRHVCSNRLYLLELLQRQEARKITFGLSNLKTHLLIQMLGAIAITEFVRQAVTIQLNQFNSAVIIKVVLVSVPY